MPAAFSRAQVEAVAALANLELDEQEIDLFGRQLADILEYATQVQAIDTTGVPPTASVITPHSADRADCGHGRDQAVIDAKDVVHVCEVVRRRGYTG